MARVTTFQRLDQNAVRALLTSPARGVVQDLMRRGLRVESAAKRRRDDEVFACPFCLRAPVAANAAARFGGRLRVATQ